MLLQAYLPSSRSVLTRRVGLFVVASTLTLSGLAQNTDTSQSNSDQKKEEEIVTLEKFEVVSGIAGSLAAAADRKEHAPVIAEIIASEDLGKLPDVSIADSLTRLTGLTTQRINGRSQAINIRGLTGDFSVATLNGREQVSTGLNRAVEFDQYPAELLDSVTVKKTASADMVAQGLAGTIDLQTVSPLAKGKRQVVVAAQYEFTKLGQLTPGIRKDGERITAAYVDQFDDGKVGIAIGVAHTSTPFAGEQFQAWGYPTDSAGNLVLGGTKSYVRNSLLTRTGYVGVIEYKPNNFVHSRIDLYASTFEEKQLLRGLEIPMAIWSSAQLQTPYTVTNGLITDFTLKNVQPVVRNDVVTRNDNLYSIGWNLKLGDGTGWTTTFDAGYSRVTRKERNLETYSGLGFAGGAANPDTLKVKLIPGGIPVLTPTVDYSNASQFKLTDPQGWGTGTLPVTGMEGYLKYFQSKDELGQFSLTTEHSLPKFFKNFEVGASYTDHFKRDGERPTGFIYNANGTSTAALPPIIGTTDMTFLGLGHIYAYDPIAAYDNGVYKFYPNPNNDVVANRWNVLEKISRAFTQFNVDTKVGDMPLTGNVGLQVINADQHSEGNSATGSGGSLKSVHVSDGATYTDVAPSLNLSLEPLNSYYIRLGVARQIARPRMYDMRAASNFSYDATLSSSTDLNKSPWGGDAGNPKLKPWKADALDLSLEKYFAHNKGYVSLAGFYKKLLSYIYQQQVLADFSGYPTTDGSSPKLTQGSATTPVNGSGGSLKGVEFTLNLQADLISPSLKGFGVELNGAYTESDIEPWGPGNGHAPLPNLSRKAGNVTLFWERDGFSIRVSERYRSDYRAYITNFGAPNFKGDINSGSGFSMSQAEAVIDAQVSYTIQKGSLKGLGFLVQAYNLNDEPVVTYNANDPRQVTNYQKYGASYSAGINYRF